ncbi:MAG: hypothetical protein KGL39_41060 [Patescibacteria group bacterium]|nr:hypothetical protein [Patescibacteria group bacterium]
MICDLVATARLQPEPLDWQGVEMGIACRFASSGSNEQINVIRAASPYSALVNVMLLKSSGRDLSRSSLSLLDHSTCFGPERDLCINKLQAMGVGDILYSCRNVFSLLYDNDLYGQMAFRVLTRELRLEDKSPMIVARRRRGVCAWVWSDIAYLFAAGYDLSKFKLNVFRRNVHLHDAWWWVLEGIVVVADRPVMIQRDEQGRLHCDDGPAVKYADGWGFWMQHGKLAEN